MPGGVISYQDFQTSNGAFANDGGPWMVYRSYLDDINCGARQDAWCRDYAYCLACWVFPSSSQPSYTVSLFTNISFELDRFGNASQLDYEWKYAPWWGSSKSEVGSDLVMKSAVGDQQYTDTLKVGNWSLLQGTGQGWDGTPFSHTGTAALLTNAEKTVGYLQVAINVTFPRQPAEYINYYVKGASLKITTPTTTPLPPGNTPGSPPAAKSNTGAIVGAVLGAVAMIILAVIGFLIFRRRQKRQEGQLHDDAAPSRRSALHPTPFPPMQQNPVASTSNDTRFIIPSGGPVMTPASDQGSLLMSTSAAEHAALLPQRQTVVVSPEFSNTNSSGANGFRHSNSAYTAYTNDTPPAYIGPTSPRPPQSTVDSGTLSVTGMGGTSMSLAQFAQENRGVIPEDLEAKLLRAGYTPSDDPDAISEEEWRRDWGVTKLELSRLRALYQRGAQTGTGSSFSPSTGGGWQSHIKR